ncbi:MAG: DUF2797 domain-containing protein [Actinomycetota bacterium]|nr:DUF2797 domain-containing protein [Actinomycetota bacterium]
MTRRAILGLRWHDAEVALRVCAAAAPASTFEPLIGRTLEFRVVTPQPTHCLGRSGSGLYDCANRPTSVNRKCTPCSVADAAHASLLHHSHRRDGEPPQDGAVADHLAQPNVLYVAAFRDGSLKIGTSNAERAITRLAEQGAWMAVLVAEAVNGYLVRIVEDAVTKVVGLPQSVSMVRKLQGFERPLDDALLRVRLNEATRRIHQLIEGTDGVSAIEQPWRFDHSDRWERVVRYPADLAVGAHELTILAVCGRVVLARIPGDDGAADSFVADLGRLYGHELEWGRFGTPTLTVQGALF